MDKNKHKSHLQGELTIQEGGVSESRPNVTRPVDAIKDTDDIKLKSTPKQPDNKKWIVLLVVGCVCLCGGVVCILYALLGITSKNSSLTYPQLTLSNKSQDNIIYSDLTGEILPDATAKTAPTYCIQTPNGMDGARPQAGINQAGVVFEAIAEAGITRFAAIYQNPTSAVIGPIRSLRIYYLEWDTPFDCTIVHAGGSDDALSAVAAGGYKDLSEDYQYMYRGTHSGRLWNNLFTTSAYLAKFSANHGYTTSNVKGFARMTPAESDRSRIDTLAKEKLVITQPANGNTSELTPAVTQIGLRLGGYANYNVDYTYDAEHNRYLRSYASGDPHEVYNCPAEDLGERNPEDVCELAQLAPTVVVAMMVQEHLASDNYHEDITAVGSGTAYVFQNGAATRGTWSKSSKEAQITFTDAEGKEIKLAPGQTFVTAVPDYGSVEY